MLRLNKLTDYGVVILSELAAAPDEACTATRLASSTGIGKPTVNKLLKLFTGAGLLRSIRGRYGGYVLARPPGRIALTEIIEAVEGPMAVTECSIDTEACDRAPTCSIRPHWQYINEAIHDALDGITLEQLIQPPAKPVVYWPGRSDSEMREASGGK